MSEPSSVFDFPSSLSLSLNLLARLQGFEPRTHGLEGRCSIRLSYRRQLEKLVGARGFEPPTPCSQGRCDNQTALRPVKRPHTDRAAESIPEELGNYSDFCDRFQPFSVSRRSRRIWAAFSRAMARWLILFFSAAPSSAKVFSRSGTMKRGS